jgi:hypothetical protein
MSKHKIDPDMFKGLNEMMKNFQKNPFTPQIPTKNMFGLGNIKKYIFILAGLLFMSGFGFGVMIGLLF